MVRRIFSISIILGFLVLGLLLLTGKPASALTPTISATASRTATMGCGAVVVVTSTPSPVFTPTAPTPTRTATACGGIIYITATPGVPTSGPDLVISSITAGTSGPACANLRHYNVLVVNNGNAAAGSFVVSYSVGGVAAPTQTVSGLAAGASVVLNFPAASGSGMSAIATADSTNVIAESNESNNSLSAMLPVPSRAATCTPGGPTFTPTVTPTFTRTITRTVTPMCMMTTVPLLVAPVTSPTSQLTQVINVTLSGGSSVTITSQAGTFTSTTPVNNVFSITINLVPNSTNNLSISGTVPAMGGCAPYTQTTSRTIVQTGGVITLTPTPTGGVNQPDLLFPANALWVWDPSSYDSVNGCYHHTPVLVWRVEVSNTGSADAGSFVVSQNYDGQRVIASLPAGQTSTIYFPFPGRPVATAAAGQPTLSTMYSNFTADYNNTVSESNESNNTSRSAIPVFTPTLQSGPTRVYCKTATPGTPTPSKTPTITNTPTRTLTPTISPTIPVGGTCSPISATITAPFTYDGAGTAGNFCWQSSNLGTFINSWNMTSLTVNGVNFTNMYVAAGGYPPKLNGFWYVSYNGTAWGHFEAK